VRAVRPRARQLLPLAALAALLAGAPGARAAPAPTGVTETVRIQLVEGKLRFLAPATVDRGDELQIVNRTNPRRIGPVTFSLVRPGAIPRSKRARRRCGEPGHLCAAIAAWHGFDEREEISVNPAEAGAPGWSTMGNLRRPGDSWFSESRGDSFSQPVTAAAGTTLYFVCAIHPWVHGRIRVLPGPSEEAPAEAPPEAVPAAPTPE
jgi:hypothetical protein